MRSLTFRNILSLILLTATSCWSFQPLSASSKSSSLALGPFDFLGGFVGGGGGSATTVPKSTSDRDQQAIEAIKAAIGAPKTPSLPLLECEFPPLEALNKLGDGSLRSANLVDDANLAFCSKLVKGLAPLPMMGPKVWLLTSTTASSSFMAKTRKIVKGAMIASLRDGLPTEIGPEDRCIIVAPSVRQDYLLARQLASTGTPSVIVNALAKDPKSVGGDATMAYFLKPLTYNSQVVGYLARKFPNDWSAIDLASKQVLATYSDSQILFGQTNTPDLRDAGKLVQKAVDERAIQARKNT